MTMGKGPARSRFPVLLAGPTRLAGPLLLAGASLLLILGAPRSAAAQSWAVGAAGTANLIVGRGSGPLDGGFGIDVHGARRVAPFFSIRLNALYLPLDEQRNLGEVADNVLWIVGVGPEADVSLGAVGLYVHGFVGGAWNRQRRTSSALAEEGSGALAVGGGVGVRFRLVEGLALDLGGEVLRLGELDFARTGNTQRVVRDDPVLLRLEAGLRVALD